MTSYPWQIDRLDVDGYLRRLGVPAREPSSKALAELHEAHVRTDTGGGAPDREAMRLAGLPVVPQ